MTKSPRKLILGPIHVLAPGRSSKLSARSSKSKQFCSNFEESLPEYRNYQSNLKRSLYEQEER
ncbi:hypothetical protein DMR_32390 [Solidesulfovibrio magneticus RS-1]|uniref:Uncharacterized protein n=1 Tax=Solidesulfovibrio magneticus (strain ATCC 700980 / DSM 13731 / RS-1) TaxID=573370 RepID=C4XJI0_SOLM1|nr:hypothetical protein DMR_32390 [Solidesulfovibrio magneticus RS-1]